MKLVHQDFSRPIFEEKDDFVELIIESPECFGAYIQLKFENDVKMYGIQTNPFPYSVAFQFENDVKMYGIQTDRGFKQRKTLYCDACCLRMM